MLSLRKSATAATSPSPAGVAADAGVQSASSHVRKQGYLTKTNDKLKEQQRYYVLEKGTLTWYAGAGRVVVRASVASVHGRTLSVDLRGCLCGCTLIFCAVCAVCALDCLLYCGVVVLPVEPCPSFSMLTRL
jgi:hypothetical protein